MMCSWTVGTVAKFISATHIGIRSKPSSGTFGAYRDLAPGVNGNGVHAVAVDDEVKSYFR